MNAVIADKYHTTEEVVLERFINSFHLIIADSAENRMHLHDCHPALISIAIDKLPTTICGERKIKTEGPPRARAKDKTHKKGPVVISDRSVIIRVTQTPNTPGLTD